MGFRKLFPLFLLIINNLSHFSTETAVNCLTLIEEKSENPQPKLAYRQKKRDDSQLAHLIHFLSRNAHLLNHPSVKEFIASQCVRLQASGEFLFLLGGKTSKISSMQYDLCKLVYSRSIPLCIREPLRAIYGCMLRNKNRPLELSSLHSSSDEIKSTSDEYEYFNYRNEIKRLAIDVSFEVEGSDYRSKGIRQLIHTPKKGEYHLHRELIAKDMQEFQSGRRCFIFQSTRGKPVPLLKIYTNLPKSV